MKFGIVPRALNKTTSRHDSSIDRVGTHVLKSGFINAGSRHELYFEEWGASAGVPVVALHGGPGSSFNATFKQLFDPTRHRVFFFDQRGSGKSLPTGRIENNTTTDLVSDIDRVRAELGVVGAVNVAGGSWGATLALLYAEHRPENVRELMLWSTFLATKKEIYDPLGEQTSDRKFPHPSAWHQFIRLVPRQLRKDPQKIIEYSLSVFNSMDAAKAWELAVAYTAYDIATCNSPSYSERKVREEAESDSNVVHAARIQMYYFANGCFIAENQILNNVARIRGIKASVVHGVDDWCTRPKASADLQKAYGQNMTVKYVKSGHLRSDPEMKKALQAIANGLS